MASTLPMLQTYRNLGTLLERIQAAKQPDAFTHKFLYETIGLKGVNDRPLIAFLRTLGFLDTSGKPTPEYAKLKNNAEAKRAIARAIRHAYAPLFAANENAHKLPQDQLRGLIAQVAGSDANTTTRILGTLTSLIKLADFDGQANITPPTPPKSEDEDQPPETPPAPGLRPEFVYSLQIHLPANGSEETYLNIFNALRKVFK
jgi:Family of unknown function (DUF5343)